MGWDRWRWRWKGEWWYRRWQRRLTIGDMEVRGWCRDGFWKNKNKKYLFHRENHVFHRVHHVGLIINPKPVRTQTNRPTLTPSILHLFQRWVHVRRHSTSILCSHKFSLIYFLWIVTLVKGLWTWGAFIDILRLYFLFFSFFCSQVPNDQCTPRSGKLELHFVKMFLVVFKKNTKWFKFTKDVNFWTDNTDF